MRKLIKRLWRNAFPHRGYVIVYDGIDHDGETHTEEYYGYFSTPAEARIMWKSFTEGLEPFENVKLCRIMEDWS